MKKIMFNDKYGLTQAVLEGRKTQTRRILKCPKKFCGKDVSGFRICTNKQGLQFSYLVDEDECEIEGSVNILSAYKIGEEVAVAQSYSSVIDYLPQDPTALDTSDGIDNFTYHDYRKEAGWNNKMFVRADLMPHRIKITNIRIERLQDISEKDCLKEGVTKIQWEHITDFYYMSKATPHRYGLAKDAFSSLIDKVSGKGTWESNPWVFVYDFELIK